MAGRIDPTSLADRPVIRPEVKDRIAEFMDADRRWDYTDAVNALLMIGSDAHRERTSRKEAVVR